MVRNKELPESQVGVVYYYALLWMYYAIWFDIGYLFGIVSWPVIVSILFAFILIRLSPVNEKRFLGMLISVAILLPATYAPYLVTLLSQKRKLSHKSRKLLTNAYMNYFS